MLKIINNDLYIEDVKATVLSEKYGTPLYVYSNSKILEKITEIKNDFLDKYENTHAAFACKAFCTKYICNFINKEGLWLDVVSGGELYTAIHSNFPAERIEFNGNNKTDEEIYMALDFGVERIVVDSIDELKLLEKIATKMNKKVKILFRVTPCVNTKTHEYISTANKDSKFGIPIDDSIIYPAVEYALKSNSLDFLGFHFHVGSQLFDVSSHILALKVILNIVKETKARFDFDVKDINLGGGFGVRYTEDDESIQLRAFINPMMDMIDSFCKTNKISRPHISIEPGRFLVAEAGVQLYTIGTIKEIPGVKTYASIDGGMTDNIRPGLYGAKYEAVVANKASSKNLKKYDISGKCCESTDILIKGIMLPELERGDVIAVMATGAYGYAMANNYNKLLIPEVVVVNGSNHRIVVKRQSYDEILSRESF